MMQFDAQRPISELSRAAFPYLAVATAGIVAYYLAVETPLLGFLLSLGGVWAPASVLPNGAFTLPQVVLIAILVLGAGFLGLAFEALAFGPVVAGFAIWSAAAIGGSHIARDAYGLQVDATPAIIVPTAVYFAALVRQHAIILRERFVRDMAIRHRDTLIQSVIENSAQGVFICDDTGRIVFCNRTGLEMFGHDDAAVLGAAIDLLTPSIGQGRIGRTLSDYVAEARDGGVQVGPVQATGLRADGSTFPMQLVVAVTRQIAVDHPLEMRKADRLLFVCYMADVGARRRMHEAQTDAANKLALANRSRDEFLANMSHELRTPLNAVIGFSELLEAGIYGALSEKQTDSVHSIHSSAQHLLRIINDILDISKLEAGKTELHEEEIDVRDVIASCITLMHPRADESHLTLKVREQSTIHRIYADERRTKQVLLNLLSNAVKFTPFGGRIEVLIRFLPTSACAISVVDTGVGIPENKIAICLTPFGQVDSGLDRQFEGTGLGLPLARSLMEAHGGTLDLTSIVGVGTTAVIEFPPERTRDAIPGTPKTDDAVEPQLSRLRAKSGGVFAKGIG